MYKIPLFILCVLTNSVFPFVVILSFEVSEARDLFSLTQHDVRVLLCNYIQEKPNFKKTGEKRKESSYFVYILQKESLCENTNKNCFKLNQHGKKQFFCIKKLNNSQLWVLSQFFFDSVNCIPMRFDLMTEILITIFARWSSVNNFDSLAI